MVQNVRKSQPEFITCCNLNIDPSTFQTIESFSQLTDSQGGISVTGRLAHVNIRPDGPMEKTCFEIHLMNFPASSSNSKDGLVTHLVLPQKQMSRVYRSLHVFDREIAIISFLMCSAAKPRCLRLMYIHARSAHENHNMSIDAPQYKISPNEQPFALKLRNTSEAFFIPVCPSSNGMAAPFLDGPLFNTQY